MISLLCGREETKKIYIIMVEREIGETRKKLLTIDNKMIVARGKMGVGIGLYPGYTSGFARLVWLWRWE